MTRRFLFAFAAGMAVMSPAYAAVSEADCRAEWTAADVNKDGFLDANEASRYAVSLQAAGQPLAAGGKLDEATFLRDCSAGLFQRAKAEPGAPFAGANSFTEGQAQDRARGAGFANVSALMKDDKGIWRGTAESNGKKVNIAVDFKGNVVATP